ncbi:hypothetical protein DB88DRAFT_154545 [Papiliotrema laurentii]|uniref:Uncharacterized protein n=1 Tax=Papiliotrema laurentii TaxID=5418 RepID=A0AAD9FU34_PAPLA|nr:hypothetical protein DB88DRAFT_154545 [Papiliotrema laurentii]
MHAGGEGVLLTVERVMGSLRSLCRSFFLTLTLVGLVLVSVDSLHWILSDRRPITPANPGRDTLHPSVPETLQPTLASGGLVFLRAFQTGPRGIGPQRSTHYAVDRTHKARHCSHRRHSLHTSKPHRPLTRLGQWSRQSFPVCPFHLRTNSVWIRFHSGLFVSSSVSRPLRIPVVSAVPNPPVPPSLQRDPFRPSPLCWSPEHGSRIDAPGECGGGPWPWRESA